MKHAKVLIACEFSGTVRDTFIARGISAISCDILPTRSKGPHIQKDVLSVLNRDWELMIAHPPCTYLAAVGLQHTRKFCDIDAALEFVRTLMDAPIPRICIENPVGIISTQIRKPTQIINPFQFGHPFSKKTCLWLQNLPKLLPTNTVPHDKTIDDLHNEGLPRNLRRSVTFPGIAAAMAEQWGWLLR